MYRTLLLPLLAACASPSVPVVAITAPTLADDTAAEAAEPEPAPTPPSTCAALSTVERDFLPQGGSILAERAACEAVTHAVAGAEGSTLQLVLTAWGGVQPAHVQVTDLLGAPVATLDAAASGDVLAFTLDRSGEYLVTVTPTDADEPANGYALAAECVAGCERAYTRHPVVFMHGMGGTDAYLDLVTYFYRVEETLSEAGYAVFMPTVDPFEVTSARAREWSAHLDELVVAGEGRRFNLIGHSQGGLDARYLASLLDDGGRVVSVTTVGTPHRGSPVADVTSGFLDVAWLAELSLSALGDALGVFLGADADQDLSAQIAFLGTENMAAFNEDVLDRGDVYYASWAGRTCGALDLGCIDETGGEIVDPLLSVSFLLISAVEGDSDGIVPVSSAAWGELRGTLPADHVDEVGHLFGSTAFDHLAFYRDEVAHLSSLGY